MADSPYLPITHWYQAHHPWLCRWLNKKVGCAHHAADLAQDTFVKLLLKQEGLQHVYTPRIYLLQIAKGLMIDQWRRQALEQSYLNALSQEESSYISQEQQAMIVEALLEVDAMLSRLNPKAKAAFLLAQIYGFQYQEIADRLAVSERMVKKYMANAMMHCLLLRQQWQSERQAA